MTHEHQFIRHSRFDHAPCPGGHHTSFTVLICLCGCKTARMFPFDNFTLTTKSFQADMAKLLNDAGWCLQVE